MVDPGFVISWADANEAGSVDGLMAFIEAAADTFPDYEMIEDEVLEEKFAGDEF